MEQHIEIPVSVYLGEVDITDVTGRATLNVADDGPVELVIPVRLGALGWVSIRFD